MLAEGAVAVVAEDWVRPGSHQETEQSVDDSSACHLVLLRPLVRLVQAEGEGGAHVETEEIFVDGLEISKHFLDLIDNVVDIVFSELLDSLVRNRV